MNRKLLVAILVLIISVISFASLLLFLIFNKIFSPQFILWLLPFFVLSQNMSTRTFYFLEAANMVIFFLTIYWLLASREPVFLAISDISTIARSIILAYLVLVVLKTTDQPRKFIYNSST